MTRYNLRNATWITIYWAIVGLMAFGFESIVLFNTRTLVDHIVTFLLFMVPPILVGLPFIIFEKEILKPWIHKYNFKESLVWRILIYLGGILGVYSGIRFLISRTSFINLDPDEFFLLKYAFVWGIGSILVLIFNNLSERLDPSIFKSWLKGEYFKPRDEIRVFLFCDINHSTTIAEDLGSASYFQFLDKFYDLITPAIKKYRGEIYQYVGDEVVISWTLDKAKYKNNAIELFFYLQKILNTNAIDFLDRFGYRPEIKGSLHYGTVTKGEVGLIKKELIYTGDVLNTASRMHKISKEHKVPLVISEDLLLEFSALQSFQIRNEGEFLLSGKRECLNLMSVRVRIADNDL